MRAGKTWMRRMIVSLACMLTVAGVRSGRGQELSSALPGPISSLELTLYAEAMDLAPEQMRALEEIHGRYKADFAMQGAEGGAISVFVQARKAIEGVPFRGPPPQADFEKWLSSHQSACNAIKALDERMFDELAPLLVDGQQPLLHRAKMSRERARLMGDEFIHDWFDASAITDVCEVFALFEREADSDVTPDQGAAAWALLDVYQAQWVAKLRSLQDASRDMRRQWANALQQQGVPADALDFSKGKPDEEMMNLIATTWIDAAEKIKPTATDLMRLNRSTAKRIAGALSSEAGRDFTYAYLRSANANVVSSLVSQEDAIERAMAMDDLTDAEQEALAARLDAFRAQADALAEECADAREAISLAQGPSYTRMTSEMNDRHTVAYRAIHEANAAAQRDLANLLGEARLRVHLDKGTGLAARLPEEERVRIGEGLPDSAMADAISEREVEAIMQALRLPEGSTTVVRQIHAEYRAQYRTRFDDSSKAMDDLHIAFMERGNKPEHGWHRSSYAPPEDVEKAIVLERRSVASLRALDVAFFDDLQTALGVDADALWRVRLARDWSVLARGGRKGLDDLRAYEANVSLQAITDGLSLTPEEWMKVDGVLRPRAEELLAAAQAHFDANRAAWFAHDIYMAHSMGPVRSAPEVSQKAEAEALELEQAAEKKRAALAVITRAMLDELCAALPARAEALRDGYERAAYPRVFNDPGDAGPVLTNALVLKDLNDPQRTELQAAAEEFRPAYRDVCTRMIAVNLEWDAQTQYTPDGRKKRDEAKYKWEQLVFERNELNAGVRATLQRMLTAEQRAAIGLRES